MSPLVDIDFCFQWGSLVLNLESESKAKDNIISELKEEITSLKKGEVDSLEAKIHALEEEIAHLGNVLDKWRIS